MRRASDSARPSVLTSYSVTAAFPGQEKTWKLNEERAGGGCLIDPGIHLLDLCMLLAPDGLEVLEVDLVRILEDRY